MASRSTISWTAIASSLAIEYALTVDRVPVDRTVMEKVAYAVEAFGVTDEVATLKQSLAAKINQLEKKASAQSEGSWLTKQAQFLGELSFAKDIPVLVKQAEELFAEITAQGQTPCEEILQYSGNAYLSKEAALGALQARYQLTRNETLLKIASALSLQNDFLEAGPLARNLCSTLTEMDKEAGLHIKGFDFYKETMVTKSAAISNSMVQLGNGSYPMSKIAQIPESYLKSYMGDEFAQEMQSDPNSARAMVESLPMDMKNVLVSLLKNV